MFRKKKTQGTVTVFEEKPDKFDDLGLSSPAAASAFSPAQNQTQPLEQMSTQQLEALAIKEATAGKDSTTRALRMANEAREIGVNTATVMQKQTEQLEKMSEDIEVVHDYLDKSERIIDKMSKPKLVRMFQRKKAGGKGLDKLKASRKDQDNREEMRKKGISAIQLDAMDNTSKEHISLEQLERDQLLDTETVEKEGKRGKLGRKKKGTVVVVDAKDVKEDYSAYSEGVANVMKQQDDDLDHISDALADMKALAGAMNNELDYQDKLITEVQDFTAETSVRTKENARKINKIK